MKKYLGLDLGTASLGFCLIKFDEDQPSQSEILWSGVRIFPEALDDSNQPKNQKRRDNRLARRQTKRSNLKRYLINNFLNESGLIDKEDSPQNRHPYTPYHLRVKGLREQLSIPEIGTIIRHMAFHPAFVGSPKMSFDDDTETTEAEKPKKPRTPKQLEKEESKKLKKETERAEKLKRWHSITDTEQHKQEISEHLEKQLEAQNLYVSEWLLACTSWNWHYESADRFTCNTDRLEMYVGRYFF